MRGFSFDRPNDLFFIFFADGNGISSLFGMHLFEMTPMRLRLAGIPRYTKTEVAYLVLTANLDHLY